MTNNGKVLKSILSAQRCADKKLGTVLSKMESIETLVTKHEQLLYGDPEKMGEGGLIFKTQLQDSQITGLGKSIDYTRSTFVLIWTGIFAIIQLAFTGIKHFLSGK